MNRKFVLPLLLVATVLLAAGCSSQPDRWLIGPDQATADEVTAALNQHEKWFAGDADSGGWNVQDGAACFLPAVEDGGAMIAPSTVWCGPAYTPESTAGLPWVVYDAEAAGGSLATGLAAEPIDPRPADMAVEDGPMGVDATLVRPDGTEPIPSRAVTIERP